ncbi:MAG: ATP-binding cassette domain-containing protein [Oscillospiraceae bacterium]|jgi:cell division transport system ATP-binding protein|nr:ATP-binding cassette domain-containing protein [Oscillospiraceae bacterium]MDE6955391.1 ATP-binding cassette domain-containing protein [Oscillospiraceae bacterium]
MPTIELENVTKVYKPKRRRKGLVHTDMGVEEVNLTIRQGEFVFVVGASGSGKSTLLRLITGEIRPNEGRVCVDEKELGWMLKLSRNRAAMMFGKIWQDPTLIRKKTIGDNLALAVKIAFGRESPRLVDLRIKKVLGLVGLKGVEKKYPVELSIGECRRVELARALIASPPVLVLDEITANLDDDCIWDTLHLLNDVNRRGTTVIMATHDSQYVNILRRRVITMSGGRVIGDIQKGKYGDVLERDRDTGLPPRAGADLI